MVQNVIRCGWCSGDTLYQAYHDHEWGKPEFDDQKLFEMLVLEGAQAGLSWITILRKREAYRTAFHDFNPLVVAAMTEDDVTKLLQNPAIVRNRSKIRSAINNAKVFLTLQREHGSFASWLWAYVEGSPVLNSWRHHTDVPPSTPLSDKISKNLEQAGMRFVGSRIIYAYLQAVGVVNDHVLACFCYPLQQDARF